MSGLVASNLLSGLPLLGSGRTRRESSWDRTGGNRDNVRIDPGASHTLADIEGAGAITHIWMTVASPDPYWGRRLVLRAFWDGEDSPSVEVPLGDFFGHGNCRFTEFWSLPLTAGPVGGRGLNCFFPMPFSEGARIEVENQGALPAMALYYYVDYESYSPGSPEHEGLAEAGRFHAAWNREGPTEATEYHGEEPIFGFRGQNLDGAGNYVLLDAEGRGHYAGCFVFIHNTAGGWWGEGDDMIFIDGEEFPPTLHGTGTEDYFGTAWSPSEAYCSPYHGISYSQHRDWTGFTNWYRFHLTDPVRFEKSIRVTIEHGHANDRSDDWSSVAYWYQLEPHRVGGALAPHEARIPPASDGEAAVMRRLEAAMGRLTAEADAEPEGGTGQMTIFMRMFLLGRQTDELLAKGNFDALDGLLSQMGA